MENLYSALLPGRERPRRSYGLMALMIGGLLYSAYWSLKPAPGSALRDQRQKHAANDLKQASSDSRDLAFHRAMCHDILHFSARVLATSSKPTS